MWTKFSTIESISLSNSKVSHFESSCEICLTFEMHRNHEPISVFYIFRRQRDFLRNIFELQFITVSEHGCSRKKKVRCVCLKYVLAWVYSIKRQLLRSDEKVEDCTWHNFSARPTKLTFESSTVPDIVKELFLRSNLEVIKVQLWLIRSFWLRARPRFWECSHHAGTECFAMKF